MREDGGRSCENRSLSDLPVVSLSVDEAREKFRGLTGVLPSAHQQEAATNTVEMKDGHH